MKIGKLLSIIVSFAMVATVFVVAVPVNVSGYYHSISIRADGTVYPSDAPISIVGNTYRLTDDIGSISVDKPGITLDGAGYSVGYGIMGGYDVAINLGNSWYMPVIDVTITNFNIVNSIGILLQSSNTNIKIINNNFEPDSPVGGPGVFLDRYSHGNTISGNTFSGFEYAILMEHSDQNTISDNTISGSWIGIYTWACSDNTISGNTISDSDIDILLSATINTKLTNNAMVGGGFRLYGSQIEYWNTHDIDSSNTENGKPIYYWKNRAGGTVPLGAAQVILANCNNVIVENQDISDVYIGISLAYSSGNTIRNNNIALNDGYYGIYLFNSDSNTISGNTILNTGSSPYISLSYGILLTGSDSNTVSDNAVLNIWLVGIVLGGSSNTVSRNTLSGCANGIALDGIGNTITGNTISNNNYGFGIGVGGQDHVISGNVISGFAVGINVIPPRRGFSRDHTITSNYIRDNTQYGIKLVDSTGVEVWNNDFVGNAVQAYVSGGSGNIFNKASPTGGNYWDDYDEPGEGAVDADDDGFFDSPYIFTGGQDNLPWVNSFLYTPTGPDVDIYPDPDVSMSFDEITEAGTTTVTTGTTNPGDDLAEFKFLGTYYDISTTATFTGDIIICISYDDTGMTQNEEEKLKLRHWDGTDWVVVDPQTIDIDNNIICGTVTSLSAFAIGFEVTPVDIDIKPGSDPNSINLGSEGSVPVAILTTADFDATNVDPETVSLAGASVGLKGKSNKLMASIEDVDGDGDDDLIVHIDIEELDLVPGSTTAALFGFTYDDIEFKGIDTVNIVPP